MISRSGAVVLKSAKNAKSAIKSLIVLVMERPDSERQVDFLIRKGALVALLTLLILIVGWLILLWGTKTQMANISTFSPEIQEIVSYYFTFH